MLSSNNLSMIRQSSFIDVSGMSEYAPLHHSSIYRELPALAATISTSIKLIMKQLIIINLAKKYNFIHGWIFPYTVLILFSRCVSISACQYSCYKPADNGILTIN